MTQSVTCLSTKHEYLPTLTSPTPMEKLRMVVYLCKTSAVDVDIGGVFPGAHWPASLARWINDPVPKNKVQTYRRHHSVCMMYK